MDTINIVIALVLIAWTTINLIASVSIARRERELDDAAKELQDMIVNAKVAIARQQEGLKFLGMFVDEAERRRNTEGAS